MAQAGHIVSKSGQMNEVMETAQSVAGTDAPVLIRGEPGTGKEHLARVIHGNSARRYRPFVPVLCCARERDLEETLFGIPGAGSGAAARSWRGRLELANGGTLFLREVGAMGPTVQAAILEVLERRCFSRPGAGEIVAVDVRPICSSTAGLNKQVEQGAFSRELCARLGVAVISIPSLRDRREDIPVLAQHFLEELAPRTNRSFTGFDPGAMDALVRHAWPGNVRELSNAVERALLVGHPPTIRAEALALAPTGPQSALASLAEVELAHIQRVLGETGWNITRAARILQVDRVTLYNKIRKHALRREDALPGPGSPG